MRGWLSKALLTGVLALPVLAPQVTPIGADKLPVGCTNGQIPAYNTTTRVWACATDSAGTVTSVAASVPTGLSIAGSPVTTSGTLAFTLTSGYMIPGGGNSGEHLRSNGASAPTWEAVTTTAPCGSTADVQINTAGAFGCETGVFTYTAATNTLEIDTVNSNAGTALALASIAPAQQATSQAGVNATLTASAATAGSSSGAAAGGAITITAGAAALAGAGGVSASGGAITLTAGAGISDGINNGHGGNVTLTGGAPAGAGTGGAIVLTGAASSGNSTTAGPLTFTSGASAYTSASGVVTIASGVGSGATVSGAVGLRSGNSTASNAAGIGTVTVAAGAYTTAISGNGPVGVAGGIVNVTAGTGQESSGFGGSIAGAGGALNLTAGAGGAETNTNSTAGAGGILTAKSGAGGVASGTATQTGGASGAATFGTGVGGVGLNQGGAGGQLNIVAGDGGAANAGSGTRNGGNGGSVVFASGTGGTGVTSNGTVGTLQFKIGATEYARFHTNGSLRLTGTTLESLGTVPTISGACGADTQTGGAYGGTFKSQTTGACAVTLTFSITATTGYACFAQNTTTPANIFIQNGGSTTTATFTGTTVDEDVIRYFCFAY